LPIGLVAACARSERKEDHHDLAEPTAADEEIFAVPSAQRRPDADDNDAHAVES